MCSESRPSRRLSAWLALAACASLNGCGSNPAASPSAPAVAAALPDAPPDFTLSLTVLRAPGVADAEPSARFVLGPDWTLRAALGTRQQPVSTETLPPPVAQLDRQQVRRIYDIARRVPAGGRATATAPRARGQTVLLVEMLADGSRTSRADTWSQLDAGDPPPTQPLADALWELARLPRR